MTEPESESAFITHYTFAKLTIVFLFLAATVGTLGAVFRHQINPAEDWAAYFFLIITALAFFRAMFQPRTVTLLISISLSLGMLIFSMVIFMHL